MKPPKLTPVESSNIDALGYNDAGLWVRFKSGGLYRYPKCPRTIYDDGLKAPSVGQWFRSAVMGTFKHETVNA